MDIFQNIQRVLAHSQSEGVNETMHDRLTRRLAAPPPEYSQTNICRLAARAEKESVRTPAVNIYDIESEDES